MLSLVLLALGLPSSPPLLLPKKWRKKVPPEGELGLLAIAAAVPAPAPVEKEKEPPRALLPPPALG